MAMRSGPSARASQNCARRQRKRNGGPSGTSDRGTEFLPAFPTGAGAAAADRLAPARRPVLVRAKSRSCAGTAALCGFGNMGVLRHKALHPGLANRAASRSTRKLDLAAGIFVAVKADGGGLRSRSASKRFQPDQVEAETGIQRIGQRIQPFAQQPQHHVRHRARRRPVLTAMRRTLPSARKKDASSTAQAAALAFQNFAQDLRQAEQRSGDGVSR